MNGSKGGVSMANHVGSYQRARPTCQGVWAWEESEELFVARADNVRARHKVRNPP